MMAVRLLAKKLEVNYDRQIFNQLTESIELTEKLQKEISELKKTHRHELYELTESHRREILKQKESYHDELYEMSIDKTKMEKRMEQKLVKKEEQLQSSYDLDTTEQKLIYDREIYSVKKYYETGITKLKSDYTAEIGVLKEIIWRQTAELEKLQSENSALRGIIKQNSSNSSKPPSSDGFKKIHNSRAPTGKKAGGQVGHKGYVPKLYEKPTVVIEIKAKSCRCGGKYQYREEKYASKQLVDIEIKTNITEYREYTGICDCCGCKSRNRAPVSDIITYGNSLKSFVNMLSVEGNVSINRISQMVREFTGGVLELSEGTLCKWNRDLCKLLSPSIAKIKEKLLISPVLHKDETGVWADKKLHWFHVLSNDKYTLYYSEKRRGKDADIEAGVLPAFGGVLVHDNLKTLYHFTNCTHAECNAHILRYLKGAVESKDRVWAKDMIDFLLRAKLAVEEKTLNEAEIFDFRNEYDEILENGRLEFLQREKSDYNGDDIRLLRRLKEYKEQHLLFLSDSNVPFDNNQAERDLRMIKAKTKISGCFRANDGDSIFAVLKSYTASLRKNSLNIFNGLISAWHKKPILF
jgi:transposase